MKHARPDYDRLQDPDGLIPFDEPVFLIRGQDSIGAATVRMWAFLAALTGAEPEIVEVACAHADRMDTWPKKKVADLPEQGR